MVRYAFQQEFVRCLTGALHFSYMPGKSSRVGGKVMIKGAVVGFLSLQNNFNKIQNQLEQNLPLIRSGSKRSNCAKWV